MITKERLEELIKEGATIWSITNGTLKPIKLDSDYFSLEEKYRNYYYFETKEQAEWALKYHKTRTEELNLPMWEEIKDIKNKTIVSFYAKDKVTNTVYFHIYTKYFIVETEYKEILNAEFTEENYIKACDLCLKLFEGEDND